MCEEFEHLSLPPSGSAGPESIGPELAAIESALAALAPRPARLDRDRLLYEAGRLAALQERSWKRYGWPAAAAALAATLLVSLIVRPEPQIVERVVRVPIATPLLESSPDGPGPLGGETKLTAYVTRTMEPRRPVVFDVHSPGEMPYPRLRDMVLACGVEAWRSTSPTPSSPPPAEPVSQRQWRDELLGRADADSPPLKSLDGQLWPPQG
jgi:hypothetical protein